MSTLFDDFSLAGRRAMVTGASRGIGRAIAIALAEAGADVVVHHHEDAVVAQDVSNQITRLGRQAVVLSADFSRRGAAALLYLSAIAAAGALDVVVSNVAIQIAEPWDTVSADHFDHQVRTNWQSGFELVQHAAPPMLSRGWGRLLTIGSVQEQTPHPEMVVYAGLKAAQALMVRNLARQFAARGVTVNNLAPGVIDTDRNAARLADPGYREQVLNRIPAGRLGQPRDCAALAVLLCSDAGGYITGQSMIVDGGLSL